MGTKGRDAAFWACFLFAGAALAGWEPGLALSAGAALCVLYFYLWYVPRAKRLSRKLGLKIVVLLPLNRWWARLLVGRRISGAPLRAWEVHVVGGEGKGFLAALDADLALVEKMMPGCLFLWETSAPLPSRVRRLIREAAREGRAFWEKGGWPVPRPPGVGLELVRGHVRHGAVLLPAKNVWANPWREPAPQ